MSTFAPVMLCSSGSSTASRHESGPRRPSSCWGPPFRFDALTQTFFVVLKVSRPERPEVQALHPRYPVPSAQSAAARLSCHRHRLVSLLLGRAKRDLDLVHEAMRPQL